MKLNLENKTQELLINEKILKKIAKQVLKMKNQPTFGVALGVFFVGAEEIQKVNAEYRKKDKPTDVITFRLVDTAKNLRLNKKNFPLDYDAGNGGLYLGEIFICVDVAKVQAEEWKHSLNREVAELFVHGMLHMLGHDHEEPDEAKAMKEYEVSMYPYLDKWVK